MLNLKSIASLKDYSKSPAPGFDAVEDVRKSLGEAQWENLQILIADGKTVAFRHPASWLSLCGRLNITHPFQRQALYDHIWGQGAWLRANALDCVATQEARS